MPFSPSKNLVFIHIPKTAGSSLNDSLKPILGAHDYLFTGHINHEINYFVGLSKGQSMEHLTTQQMAKILGQKRFGSCFKFCFVRNPWDRMVSTFFWRKNDPWAAPNFKKYVQSLSFEEFVFQKKFAHTSPMYHWVIDRQKNICVDFVGRYENLKADFNTICEKIQIETPELPHTFKTEHKPFKDYYTQASIDKVAELYKDDIEIFNYDFA